MTPGQRNNLRRLLSPKNIACIGGRDAVFAATLSSDAGFEGPIWGVNPTRDRLGDAPCFPRVDLLPEPPDAVFLAVPARHSAKLVAELEALGAGGVVCFTAGFGELGEEGARREQTLVDAAGDLALVGPNCSGLLNFVDRALLWPFSQGAGPSGRGVALITQSGMLGNTLTLNRRSVPFSYVISSGNQAMLGIEDYLDVLVDDPAVTGIGMYLERLDDVSRFAKAAETAMRNGVPLVAHKAGTSEIGSRLTVTHTGSLSGDDELYQALFDRLGVVRVQSPVMLLESLKMLTVAGAPAGNRIAAFTCSGGDATMVADQGEGLGLSFPQPCGHVAKAMEGLLPELATVSNPLDYTTPLWGDEKKLPKLLSTMLGGGYDAALMVQDYPGPHLGVSRTEYEADARSFLKASRVAGIPGAICSCLAENLDDETREVLSEGGIAPLQGIDHAIEAIAGAARYGARREQLLASGDRIAWRLPPVAGANRGGRTLDEWEGKSMLRNAGLLVPVGEVTPAADAAVTAQRIGFPVAVKMLSPDLAHKTEAGAVRLNLNSADEVTGAIGEIIQSVEKCAPGAVHDRYLVEKMVEEPITEILVGVRQDPLFGLAMVIGSGGTLVELVRDARTILLPTDRGTVEKTLSSLKVARLLDGYRGGQRADRGLVVEQILAVADFAESRRASLRELDINPMMITANGAFAADVLIVDTSPVDPGTS